MNLNNPKFPYGMDPAEPTIWEATNETRRNYNGVPETTCCSKAECCNAGCPNMYFVEFLNIRRGAVDKMSKEQRLNLTIECIKRYLQDQRTRKPCVFLDGNKCGIYQHRHLKCRTYGLIPNSLYEWIATSVAKDMGVPKEEVPLCNQCQDVKVKEAFKEKFPDGVVPEEAIKAMERRFKEIDRTLGMPEKIQKDGMGFLTYHDWHLLYEFGPEWLESLTQLRLKLKDSEKEQFVASLKTAFETKMKNEDPLNSAPNKEEKNG